MKNATFIDFLRRSAKACKFLFVTAISRPQSLPQLSLKAYKIWQESGPRDIYERLKFKYHTTSKDAYRKWIELYDTLTDVDQQAILAHIEKLPDKPLISIVMPTYNTDEKWLRAAIESVRRQLYTHWELCLADDNSSKPHVHTVIREYLQLDPRIKAVFRERNGHIAEASNSALEMARGEFVALLDHDDEIPEHALYMIAEEVNAWPEADLIYSDEDKLNERGERMSPYFKSDWNPDLFYSQNCVSHFGAYRTSIIKQIGGFRKGYEGSQDYDLALRVSERIPAKNIRHIPHVLYHWREIRGSVALDAGEKQYAHEAARKAIRSHFERTRINASVIEGHGTFHRVVYPVPEPAPTVSLIIGTRDRFTLLKQTVEGLLKQTEYNSIQLIIVDNQSSEPATLDYLQGIQKDSRVKVIKYDAPFNFSAINNLGVRYADGEIIGLINNDIKVIRSDWLKEMVSHALRPQIGAVGAKLLYPDDTVQHAGIVLGIHIAAHAHRHFHRLYPGYFRRAQVIQNFSAVTGACLVMRRAVFAEVGGLDEINLPVAYNDVDLCLRIQVKGYRILWTPYAELYHLESASRGADTKAENIVRFKQAAEYLKSAWGHVLSNDPYYNPNLTLEREDFSLAFPPRSRKPWK